MLMNVQSGEFSEPRLLHSPGFIQLCINVSPKSNEKSILSCGNDGDLWIWNSDELDDAEYDPRRISNRTHNAIAWTNSKVYIGYSSVDPRTGIEKPVVSEFLYDDFSSPTMLASFSLDVTSVDVSVSGGFVAAGALDHIVKIINPETLNYCRIECDGQILCVRIDPKEELLAVATTAGDVLLYPLQTNETTDSVCAAHICSRIPDIDVTRTRMQIVWSKQGEYLFVPAVGGVQVLSRTSLQLKSTLKSDSNPNGAYSVCCISMDGKHLAASDLSGTIVVWNTETENVLSISYYKRNGATKVISSMLWHPVLSGTLFFSDTEEHICSLKNCAKEIDKSTEPICHSRRAFMDDEDDEDTRQSVDIGAIKRSYGFDEEGRFSPEIINGPSVGVPVTNFIEKIEHYRPPTVPKPFVSGSSPSHLSQRYLVLIPYFI
ncbi:hypothetical protein AB6A40_004338 [Gnathostoma spinigerum]|uniref:WDHD1 first WD40 domain-containing protein n=1 Tax=Gnathostoma spinigerum TaxID=75299 RepID=A0ABD6EJV6_9BILA